MPGDADGVMQFDVAKLLYVDRVGLEYRITTEDEGVPTVDVDTVVSVVGGEVRAIAAVVLRHRNVLGLTTGKARQKA